MLPLDLIHIYHQPPPTVGKKSADHYLLSINRYLSAILLIEEFRSHLKFVSNREHEKQTNTFSRAKGLIFATTGAETGHSSQIYQSVPSKPFIPVSRVSKDICDKTVWKQTVSICRPPNNKVEGPIQNDDISYQHFYHFERGHCLIALLTHQWKISKRSAWRLLYSFPGLQEPPHIPFTFQYITVADPLSSFGSSLP